VELVVRGTTAPPAASVVESESQAGLPGAIR
jgi:hypothetical protein